MELLGSVSQNIVKRLLESVSDQAWAGMASELLENLKEESENE
jgi:hypothetical protein